MAVGLAPVLKQRYFDSNGDPLAGGKLYTYQTGTSTPQLTYTDATGLVPNSNPIILDADGEASVWLSHELSYKFVLHDANDVLQWTTDGVVGILQENSVPTDALQDGAVTAEKLADGAITGDKIASGGITRPKLAIGAVAKKNVISYTSNQTLSDDNDVILADPSGGTFTLTLPAATTLGKRVIWIKNISAGTNITVARTGTDTFDGDTSLIVAPKMCITLVSDGTSTYHLI